MAIKLNALHPDTLRVALPNYDGFEPPADEVIAAYLQHYNMNLVASGEAIKQTIGTFVSEGYAVVAQAFFAKNTHGNAIVVHGFMDHTGLYGKLIRHLLSRGLNVYMVDLPGHGLSSGEPASINDFKHYAKAVQKLHQKSLDHCAAGPWYLLGQSMGGAVSMLLMQQQAFTVKHAVLLAPLVQPRAWLSLKLLHFALKPFIKATPRTFSANSHDTAFTEFIKNDDPLQTCVIPVRWISAMQSWRKQFLLTPPCNTPVLLIQGNQDKTIDWRFGTKQIMRLFPATEQVLIDQARHHLVNESALYIDRMFTAIDEHLALNQTPCPD